MTNAYGDIVNVDGALRVFVVTTVQTLFQDEILGTDTEVY